MPILDSILRALRLRRDPPAHVQPAIPRTQQLKLTRHIFTIDAGRGRMILVGLTPSASGWHVHAMFETLALEATAGTLEEARTKAQQLATRLACMQVETGGVRERRSNRRDGWS